MSVGLSLSELDAKARERVTRRETCANGRKFTYAELLEALRREAYAQEVAGAQEMADVLDAAHNVILATVIKNQDQQRFRGRN